VLRSANILTAILVVIACDAGQEAANPSASGAGSGGQLGVSGNPATAAGAAGDATASAGQAAGGIGGMGGATAGGAGQNAGGVAGGGGGAAGQAGGGGANDAGAAGAAGQPSEDPMSPGGPGGEPPQEWVEHWFEHNQTLQLAEYNDWVVLYFDDDVDQSQTTWLLPFLTEVWKYTVKHYGEFTDGERDGRLYGIFHQGRYSGGHPSTYFDESHDYRNVSDAGPGPWPDGSFDLASHEVSHVVEGASRGVHGSPAFGLWGDSKWAEFFQYDLYVGLGLTAEAERVFDKFSNGSDTFPQANTYWFRDWYYPLWRDHGGVAVMVNFFQLLAEHFPKNGDDYARGLNFGEYVHFMSGSVNADLKALATTAFGWPAERETEFQNAQQEFAEISYP
jgi:hypothetical protein